MAQDSTNEWTESTWNPVTGCTKISPGCKHCYAERMAMRLHAMGQPNYERGFKVSLQELCWACLSRDVDRFNAQHLSNRLC